MYSKVIQRKRKYLWLSSAAWQPGARKACCHFSFVYQSSKKDDPEHLKEWSIGKLTPPKAMDASKHIHTEKVEIV